MSCDDGAVLELVRDGRVRIAAWQRWIGARQVGEPCHRRPAVRENRNGWDRLLEGAREPELRIPGCDERAEYVLERAGRDLAGVVVYDELGAVGGEDTIEVHRLDAGRHLEVCKARRLGRRQARGIGGVLRPPGLEADGSLAQGVDAIALRGE